MRHKSLLSWVHTCSWHLVHFPSWTSLPCCSWPVAGTVWWIQSWLSQLCAFFFLIWPNLLCLFISVMSVFRASSAPLSTPLLWVCPHHKLGCFLRACFSASITSKSEVGRSCKADGIKLVLVRFYGASRFNYLATGHPKMWFNLVKNARLGQAVCSLFFPWMPFSLLLWSLCFISHLIGLKYLVLCSPLSGMESPC